MRPLYILLTSLFIVAFTFKATSQETEKKTPDLTFTVKKLTDGSYELKSRLTYMDRKIDFPIAGAAINYSVDSESPLNIEGNVTDKNGYAYAYIKPGVILPRSKEGVITINATYSGNELYESASGEALFNEARIKVTCEMVDTIQTVKVEGFKINPDGSESPLAEETVVVSVQRMFSRLPVGEVTLDESGTGSLEFPVNLPGDSIGNLHVVAFIAEHETYGNLESAATVQWGIPKQKVLVTHRALWTQIAPLWMIVSLTILLVGVWAHYAYVIFQLRRIKNRV